MKRGQGVHKRSGRTELIENTGDMTSQKSKDENISRNKILNNSNMTERSYLV